ncbi:hypothetical protein PFISCL1PPCAC_13091, partial [Pristionchus fissidentatus]
LPTMKLLIVFLLIGTVSAGMQTLGVKGRVLCGDKPAKGFVRIFDKNRFPRPDTQLAHVDIDGNGNFQLVGSDSYPVFWMKPVVRIYHSCNNKIFKIEKPCWRKYESKGIPDAYISKSASVGKWLDMGSINMELKQNNEDSHCYDNLLRKFLG